MKKLSAIIYFLLSFSVHASGYELRSSLSYLPEVIEVSDCIIQLKEFQDEVKGVKNFTSSSDTGDRVIDKFLTDKKAIVRHYTKYFSSVTAKTIGNEIYWNKKMNPRSIEKMVNTNIHERLHVLDYRHNGNSWKGNQESVPYKVGNISEKYVKKCKENL